MVGQSSSGAEALADRLRVWGFRSRRVTTFQAALELFDSIQVDVVLTNMHLSGGTGFGLTLSLSGLPVTVFVCVPLERSCLWLPAMDRGRICLGLPALRPSEFASSLEEMAMHLPSEQPDSNSSVIT